MTEWAVFGVIVALVGFVVTVVTPIIKLNTSITKLTTIIDRMEKEVGEMDSKNSTNHTKIFEQLGDHETRISVLEHAHE